MTTHSIEINYVKRALPIIEVAPGICVAVFNLLGDWEMTEAAGIGLAMALPSTIDLLVTPDGKALALAHVVQRTYTRIRSVAADDLHLNIPLLVFRKSKKGYMINPHCEEVKSVTTAGTQHLWVDSGEMTMMHGKRIAIIDDVVSTGGTLEALKRIAERAKGIVEATGAVFTEGDRRDDVISLGHLPVWRTDLDHTGTASTNP